jgi:hypothetical protein
MGPVCLCGCDVIHLKVTQAQVDLGEKGPWERKQVLVLKNKKAEAGGPSAHWGDPDLSGEFPIVGITCKFKLYLPGCDPLSMIGGHTAQGMKTRLATISKHMALKGKGIKLGQWQTQFIRGSVFKSHFLFNREAEQVHCGNEDQPWEQESTLLMRISRGNGNRL